MSGTLRADLVQHLMDEGQATKETLMALSGYPEKAVASALLALREQGTALRTKAKDALGYSAPLYSLTAKGIEVALAAAAPNNLLTRSNP